MNSEQDAALRKAFPKSTIGKLPKPTRADAAKGKCAECGGWHGLPAVHLDYVGHAAITDRLLSVDPCWTWEPLAYGPDGLPALDRFGGLWIKLTVADVTRLGYGEASGKPASATSMKEIIGDALRNAAMRFGVALDLWSKEELESAHETPAPHVPTMTEIAAMPAEELQQRLGDKFEVSTRPVKTSEPEPFKEDARKMGKASDRQVKAVIAIGHQVGLHDTGPLLEALSILCGRQIQALADLTMNDVDRVMRDKGDALAATQSTPPALAPEDDPWAIDTATAAQVNEVRALFDAIGMAQDERKDIVTVITNRDVKSLRTLTSAEATALIGHLHSLKDIA